jgi:hypothetical protein
MISLSVESSGLPINLLTGINGLEYGLDCKAIYPTLHDPSVALLLSLEPSTPPADHPILSVPAIHRLFPASFLMFDGRFFALVTWGTCPGRHIS